MSYQIETRVDPDHSVDPSYIVHYRITRDGALVQSGMAQYHRQAQHNEIPLGEKLPRATRAAVEKQIETAVANFINQKTGNKRTP